MTKKQQPKRIPKSFEERKAELIGALDILHSSLDNFDQSRQTYWLKKVAQELRALIVYEPKSGSLRHPLLLELAKEKQYPLLVYVSNFAILRETEQNKDHGMKPKFSWGEKMLSLTSESWRTKASLEEVIELPYIVIRAEKHSLKDIIRLVADTEAAHYDPDRPEALAVLQQGEIYGVQVPYMALYELGRIVQLLGERFVSSILV